MKMEHSKEEMTIRNFVNYVCTALMIFILIGFFMLADRVLEVMSLPLYVAYALVIFLIYAWMIVTQNQEVVVTKEGIDVSVFFGIIKKKSYTWSDFVFVGPIERLGSRDETYTVLVCAKKLPKRANRHRNAYIIPRRSAVLIDYVPQNFEALQPFFKGNI